MPDSTRPSRCSGRYIVPSAAAALLAICVLAASGCFVVVPVALTAATVMPERPVPQTIAEVGPMAREEGIVFGSLAVGVSDPADIESGRTAIDSSIAIHTETATYTLHVVKLGRRGERLGEHTWEADCKPGETCRFVAKLEAGDYLADAVKIAESDDENYMLEFGYVMTRLDYRFSVDAGRTRYIGRIEMKPPLLGRDGEHSLPIAVRDAASDDAPAVGLEREDAFEIALIDARWQSAPTPVYGLVR